MISMRPFGGVMSWREFTTPGAGTFPMSVKDFNLESSFHIRMSPSHDPGQNCSSGIINEGNEGRTGCD